jgi:hypothetical protein
LSASAAASREGRRARSFWELLREGRDAITEVPKSRWDVDEVFDPDPDAQGRITHAGAALGDVEHFDAAFFGVSPREAVALDPQQRLLLEVTTAIARGRRHLAGIAHGQPDGDLCRHLRNGLFGAEMEAIGARTGDFYAGSGTALAWRRVAFPTCSGCMVEPPIDTACSSSLVAMHLALAHCATARRMWPSPGRQRHPFPGRTILTCRADDVVRGALQGVRRSADSYVRARDAQWWCSSASPMPSAMVTHPRTLRGSAINHDGRSAGLTVPAARHRRP